MKDLKRLLPQFWLQNEPTSWEWDAILNDLLDEHVPIVVDSYTVKVGPIEVWVSNWPYQYGYSYRPHFRGLPSVDTRIRLRSLLGTSIQDSELNKIKELINK